MNAPIESELVSSRALAGAHGYRLSRHAVSAILFVNDAFALTFSVALAAVVGYVVSIKIFAVPYYAFEDNALTTRLVVWATLIFGTCVWFGLKGHYSIRRPLRADIPQIWTALIAALFIDGFIQFATKTPFSRSWLVSVWIVAAFILPIARVVIRHALDHFGTWKLRAMILGHGAHGDEIGQSLTRDFYLGYEIAGRAELSSLEGTNFTQIAWKTRDLMGVFHSDILILVPDSDELERVTTLMDTLNINMIRYAIVPPFHRLPLVGLQTQAFLSSDAVLMNIHRGLMAPMSQATKRVFDVLGTIFLLIVLLPFLLVISVLVALDGGPVFFRHSRVGRAGRPFDCLKFRTMVPDAGKVLQKYLAENPAARNEWQKDFKLRHDPRVTALGRFFRATSIDELPQLINVLRGEMSLVGPRPVVEDELKLYYGEDAQYYLLMRPGITGLWQISGRNDTGYERRVHLDAWYARNWSLWTDITILFGTLPSVMSARGAY